MKMKKLSLLVSLLAVGAVIGLLFACNNVKDDPTPSPFPSTQTQLATVQNIEYDQTNNLLSWDEVENANAYNVSVNGDIEQVKDEFYTIALTEEVTEFKVQAYDTTNTYLASEWSEPYVVTLSQESSLVADVNAFAESIVTHNYSLKKVLSVSAEGNYLYTNAVYEYGGKDYIYTWCTDYGQNIENLKDVLEMQDAINSTTRRLRCEIKDYDTASSFLARSDYSEQIQSLVDQGYSLSFVTSQAYESDSTTAGLNGLLKATKSGDYRYFDIDVSINVGSSGSESVRYTTGVRQASLGAIREQSFRELTGDFAEYAKELDGMQSSAQ